MGVWIERTEFSQHAQAQISPHAFRSLRRKAAVRQKDSVLLNLRLRLANSTADLERARAENDEWRMWWFGGGSAEWYRQAPLVSDLRADAPEFQAQCCQGSDACGDLLMWRPSSINVFEYPALRDQLREEAVVTLQKWVRLTAAQKFQAQQLQAQRYQAQQSQLREEAAVTLQRWVRSKTSVGVSEVVRNAQTDDDEPEFCGDQLPAIINMVFAQSQVDAARREQIAGGMTPGPLELVNNTEPLQAALVAAAAEKWKPDVPVRAEEVHYLIDRTTEALKKMHEMQHRVKQVYAVAGSLCPVCRTVVHFGCDPWGEWCEYCYHEERKLVEGRKQCTACRKLLLKSEGPDSWCLECARKMLPLI